MRPRASRRGRRASGALAGSGCSRRVTRSAISNALCFMVLSPFRLPASRVCGTTGQMRERWPQGRTEEPPDDSTDRGSCPPSGRISSPSGAPAGTATGALRPRHGLVGAGGDRRSPASPAIDGAARCAVRSGGSRRPPSPRSGSASPWAAAVGAFATPTAAATSARSSMCPPTCRAGRTLGGRQHPLCPTGCAYGQSAGARQGGRSGDERGAAGPIRSSCARPMPLLSLMTAPGRGFRRGPECLARAGSALLQILQGNRSRPGGEPCQTPPPWSTLNASDGGDESMPSKPLLCRLGRHEWHAEKTEDGRRFRVCGRCKTIEDTWMSREGNDRAARLRRPSESQCLDACSPVLSPAPAGAAGRHRSTRSHVGSRSAPLEPIAVTPPSGDNGVTPRITSSASVRPRVTVSGRGRKRGSASELKRLTKARFGWGRPLAPTRSR